MKENVGGIDRALRFAIGVPLTVLGWRARGGVVGGLFLVTGVALVESGITRVCPVNNLMGMDTSYLEGKPRGRMLPDLGLRGGDGRDRSAPAVRHGRHEPMEAEGTVPPGQSALDQVPPARAMGAPLSSRYEV